MKISKKNLISIIQNTETYSNPKIELEQYCINATCAVDIIYYAGFEYNDINEAIVIDLGAGTGRLSIASALLNACYVLSIDIDITAINILKKNIKSLELGHKIFPVCADIRYIEISKKILPKNIKITTIMNPPFGVQAQHADRIFLDRAFSFSNVVYSIHLTSLKVQKFILNYIEKFDWKVDNVLPFNMIIEKTYPFHTQKSKKISVNVFRFIKKG